jgi:hypothetical protein
MNASNLGGNQTLGRTFSSERKQRMEVPMRKLAIGLLAAAGVAIAAPASAQGFGIYLGANHPHHHWHHHWRGAYAYEPECRIIIRHHINRWGERITVRRRICE